MLKNTTTHLLCLIIILFGSVPSKAQSSAIDCQSLHDGVFYYSSNEANSHSIYIREGDIQKEVVLETGDTSVWQIRWKDNCNYTLTYLSGQGPLETLSKTYKNEIKVNVAIKQVTIDYYVYETAYNKKTHAVATSDTLWL